MNNGHVIETVAIALAGIWACGLARTVRDKFSQNSDELMTRLTDRYPWFDRLANRICCIKNVRIADSIVWCMEKGLWLSRAAIFGTMLGIGLWFGLGVVWMFLLGEDSNLLTHVGIATWVGAVWATLRPRSLAEQTDESHTRTG